MLGTDYALNWGLCESDGRKWLGAGDTMHIFKKALGGVGGKKDSGKHQKHTLSHSTSASALFHPHHIYHFAIIMIDARHLLLFNSDLEVLLVSHRAFSILARA